MSRPLSWYAPTRKKTGANTIPTTWTTFRWALVNYPPFARFVSDRHTGPSRATSFRASSGSRPEDPSDPIIQSNSSGVPLRNCMGADLPLSEDEIGSVEGPDAGRSGPDV